MTSEGTRTYHQDDLDIHIIYDGNTEPERINMTRDLRVVDITELNTRFREGRKEIPTHFTIHFKDGSFSLEAQTLADDSTEIQFSGLAIIAAATVLCGEISLLAAQTNQGELMRSHIQLERMAHRRQARNDRDKLHA